MTPITQTALDFATQQADRRARLADGTHRAQQGKDAADATDAAARLWRDAEPKLRRKHSEGGLPFRFLVDDIREILEREGLIAPSSKDQELRCLGRWGVKLGAIKRGYQNSRMSSVHGAPRVVWERTDIPETP